MGGGMGGGLGGGMGAGLGGGEQLRGPPGQQGLHSCGANGTSQSQMRASHDMNTMHANAAAALMRSMMNGHGGQGSADSSHMLLQQSLAALSQQGGGSFPGGSSSQQWTPELLNGMMPSLAHALRHAQLGWQAQQRCSSEMSSFDTLPPQHAGYAGLPSAAPHSLFGASEGLRPSGLGGYPKLDGSNLNPDDPRGLKRPFEA